MKTSTPVVIADMKTKLTKEDRILVLGSCFATNVGEKLLESGYDVCINPFGTLFNPASVASSLLRLASATPFTEADCVRMGAGSDLWCSFSHYTKFARPTKEEFLENANRALSDAASFFRTCTAVIITFGTSFVFEYVPGVPCASCDVSLCETPPEGPLPLMVPRSRGCSQQACDACGPSSRASACRTAQSPDAHGTPGTAKFIVSNCLKRPAKEFNRYMMSREEIVGMWEPLMSGLLTDRKVLFTVSPIRHMADGAHGNQLSKATLLMAEDELVGRYGNAEYFPSYEIVLDELRDYSWFAEDLVHPSPQAIETIWARFRDAVCI